MTSSFRPPLRWIVFLAVSWFLWVALPTFSPVRGWLAAPLVVSDSNAHADACYVLAGGSAMYERLSAAADLYHLKRISRIMIMENSAVGQYNFKARASWTKTAWELDYLNWLGVPASKVVILKQADGMFGSLQEARNVARYLPADVKSLVLVSSAPHMRRSLLAFRRSLPENIRITPYAATVFEHSHEKHNSIWLEYFKLLVYYMVA